MHNLMKRFAKLARRMTLLGAMVLLTTGLRAQLINVDICAGEEVCLTINAHRGDIQWQSSLDALSWSTVANGNQDTVCVFPGLDLYYRAEITEGTCDPIYSDTHFVTVHPVPVADAGADATICQNDTVTLGGSPAAIGGSPPYTYNWTPAAGLNSATAANPVATVAMTTDYVLTVTDSNGCSNTDTVHVDALTAPVADAGPDQTTNCSTAVMIGGSPTGSGGTGPLSYLWSPAGGLSSSTAPNPMALSGAPMTNYVVTVTDSIGCSGMDTMVLNVSGGIATGTDTFAFTGAPQMWIVGACVDTVTFSVWGAQGGNDGPGVQGGQGGFSTGQLVVNPGDTLWIYVGGKGTDGPGSGQNCNLSGGWNGGGMTGTTCCSNAGGGAGAGGGGSDVRVGGQSLMDRVIVAGGGGGAGSSDPGAAGGGLTGDTGTPYQGVSATGGTQSAGGTPGGHFTSHACSAGTAGSFGVGGIGDGNDGGGGGGGWYGGGGGANNGSGGGGSGYVGGVLNGSTTTGGRTGDGLIILSW